MKKIIGVVGETGSGKDTFCDYLNPVRNRERLRLRSISNGVKKIKRNVFVFRFSQSLTEALGIFFDEVRKEDQQWLATALRERFSNNILGEAIAKKIKNVKKGLIILNGIRMWEEFKMIKKFGGKIIYITADSKTRWQRIQNRGEKKDDRVSYQKFLKMEKAATEILIPKIGKKADYKIENSGSKQLFYKELRKIIQKI